MIGQIQATNKSQSGKTIGVQIDNVWYTSKNWELADSVGKTIIFEPDTSEFNGRTMHWLNDYVFEEAGNTPSGQAMNMAVARSEAAMGVQANYTTPDAPDKIMDDHHAALRALPNKDSLIGALALTKAVHGSKEEIWESFVFFYYKLEGWDSSLPF